MKTQKMKYITILMVLLTLLVPMIITTQAEQTLTKKNLETKLDLGEKKATLNGRVFGFGDNGLKLIKNAEVTLIIYNGYIPTSYSAQTNHFGKFTINDINVGNLGSSAEIYIEADGYRDFINPYWWCFPKDYGTLPFIMFGQIS